MYRYIGILNNKCFKKQGGNRWGKVVESGILWQIKCIELSNRLVNCYCDMSKFREEELADVHGNVSTCIRYKESVDYPG